MILGKAVMPIYNLGNEQTGLVVHVGGAMVTVAPVIRGRAATSSIYKSMLAGDSLTQHTRLLLAEDGENIGSTSAEKDLLISIKESVCKVPASLAEISTITDINYKLPDKRMIVVKGATRALIAEYLFSKPQEVEGL